MASVVILTFRARVAQNSRVENGYKASDSWPDPSSSIMSNSPITVLIEQPGFVPFNNALRRSSITPYGRNNLNYSTTSATTSGSSPRNSINAGNATPTTPETATTNLGRNPNRSSISSAGNHTTKEWNRRQRTSTTFHASIDVPDSLLAALSSIAIGEWPQPLPFLSPAHLSFL